MIPAPWTYIRHATDHKGPWGHIAGANARLVCDNIYEDDARLVTAAHDMRRLLAAAEAFIAGFEDDATQDGVPELLMAIRATLAKVPA